MKVLVTCLGVAPLLMEPMSDEVLESLRTGNRLPNTKGDKDVAVVAAQKIYRNGDDEPGIPADNFWSCLVEGGRMVPYKGKQMISNKEESLLGGLLRIEERFLPISKSDGTPFANGNGWRVDKRRGRLPDGTAVCLVRPCFEDWRFTATLNFNDKLIGKEKMEELINSSGTFKGLGGHRKKGYFGRFKVVGWEVLEGATNGNGAESTTAKKTRRGSAKSETATAQEAGGKD